ncbi:hypothetical protein ABPG77_004173 [Micractinium sp. CCAP 211/92]
MPRLLAVAKALACAPAHNPSLLQAARALLAAVQCRTFASSAAAWRSAEQGLPAAAAANSTSSAALLSVPVEQLQRAITPEVCQHLRRRGFAVVDNVLGGRAAAALREEVVALRQQMHRNCTHLVQRGATGLLEKEHVFEAELLLPQTQALAPLAAQLQGDSTLRVMLSVLMPELRLGSQAIKLQYNAGHGGSFPMHFDTDASVDSRKVTTIWYLNPGWKQGDGGELRLYPFPEAPVDVEPLNDRMVLFSSQHMLHRVLPSAAERYCFTIWLSEDGPLRRPSGAMGDGATLEHERSELRRALSSAEPLGASEAWRLAVHPELRKHAAKWVHRAEWERSLRESHPTGPALDQALQTFQTEVGIIERALAPLLPVVAAGAPPDGLPRPAWF